MAKLKLFIIQFNQVTNQFSIDFFDNVQDAQAIQTNLISAAQGQQIKYTSIYYDETTKRTSKPQYFDLTIPVVIPFVHTKFGLLYNFAAITNVNPIFAAGWKIPSLQEWEAILNPNNDNWSLTKHYRDNTSNLWENSYQDHLNDYKLNALPSGIIESSGSFLFAYQTFYFASITSDVPGNYRAMCINYNSDDLSAIATSKKSGSAVRIVKQSTTLNNGESGLYTGNDGQIYRTICINGFEILADNLAETKFRDGSTITKQIDTDSFINQNIPSSIAYNLADSLIYF